MQSDARLHRSDQFIDGIEMILEIEGHKQIPVFNELFVLVSCLFQITGTRSTPVLQGSPGSMPIVAPNLAGPSRTAPGRAV